MAASVPQTVVFAFDGPIAPADLRGLGDKVSAVLDSANADVALCDVTRAAPDAVTVDALARVQLAARRRGCRAALQGASTELLELLDFIGLRNVLPD
jgi:ABC-type transporter Mla MlaB component